MSLREETLLVGLEYFGGNLLPLGYHGFNLGIYVVHVASPFL